MRIKKTYNMRYRAGRVNIILCEIHHHYISFSYVHFTLLVLVFFVICLAPFSKEKVERERERERERKRGESTYRKLFAREEGLGEPSTGERRF